MAQERKYGEIPTKIDIAYLHGTPLILKAGPGKYFPVKLLNVVGDTRTIAEAIKSSGRSYVWKRNAATPSALVSAVGRGCRILHFSGHGSNTATLPGLTSPKNVPQNPSLAFEDNKNGALLYLSAEKLSQCLSNREEHDERVMLVVLMACESAGVAQALVRSGGCSHSIAINAQQNVSDKDAMAFMEKFYEQLLSGRSIQYSFEAALVDVTAAGHIEAGKFQLFNAENANPRESKMPLPENGEARDLSDQFTGTAVHVPTYFMGRQIDLYKITEMFINGARSCIQLVGDGGIGKSTVAAAFVRRVRDRNRWDVLWVDLHGVEQTFVVVQRVIKALKNTYPTAYVDLPTDEQVEEDVENAIKIVCHQVREHVWFAAIESMLIVLDGIEFALVVAPETRALRLFINGLTSLPDMSLRIRILLTARTSVTEIPGSFSHPMTGLSQEDSAQLMNKLKPHDNISLLVNRKGSATMDDIWECIKPTHGNPGVIAGLAVKISDGARLNEVVTHHLHTVVTAVNQGAHHFKNTIVYPESDTSGNPDAASQARSSSPKRSAVEVDDDMYPRSDDENQEEESLYDAAPDGDTDNWLVWSGTLDRKAAEAILRDFVVGDCLIRESKNHLTLSVKDTKRVVHNTLTWSVADNGYIAEVGSRRERTPFKTLQAFVKQHSLCKQILLKHFFDKQNKGPALPKRWLEWLHGPMDRQDTRMTLSQAELMVEGAFLLRFSSKKERSVIVSCWVRPMRGRLSIKHFDIKYSGGSWQLRLRDTSGEESSVGIADLAECLTRNQQWKRMLLVNGSLVDKDVVQDEDNSKVGNDQKSAGRSARSGGNAYAAISRETDEKSTGHSARSGGNAYAAISRDPPVMFNGQQAQRGNQNAYVPFARTPRVESAYVVPCAENAEYRFSPTPSSGQ